MRLRLLTAACLLLGCTGFAHAVPMYFNFTGTGSSSTPGGFVQQPVSGGFTFETDALNPNSPAGEPPQLAFVDFPLSGHPAASTFLTIGSESIDVQRYTTGYALINFVDACNAVGECVAGWGENFNLYANSSDFTSDPNLTGTFHSTSLFLISIAPFSPLGQPLDYFDISQGIDPLAITTLPLYSLFASYASFTYDCVAGACTTTGDEQWSINIDSVSRGVLAVSEPGTLGLLALGVVLLVGRRRRMIGHA